MRKLTGNFDWGWVPSGKVSQPNIGGVSSRFENVFVRYQSRQNNAFISGPSEISIFKAFKNRRYRYVSNSSVENMWRYDTQMTLQNRLSSLRCPDAENNWIPNDLVTSMESKYETPKTEYYNAGLFTVFRVAPEYKTPKTELYRGVVKGLDDSSVLVTVSSPGDWDRWDARIPLASFDQSPQVGQEFSCTITIYGSDISIRAKILQDKTPRTLKDFDIDKEELLEWASKIDV